MKRLIAGGLAGRLNGRVYPPTVMPSTTNLLKQASRVSDEVRWSNVIKVASKAVVALRMSTVRSFDGSFAACSQATGFVVDKELGLILTNRHVVLVGPVTAEAIFENHEGVVCKPIYRDPIHDFAFCTLDCEPVKEKRLTMWVTVKYDPASVQYMDVGEIELYSRGAQIGKEIRVLGNDAGEKIMVLRG
jgi:S1-C subfamily serine protease